MDQTSENKYRLIAQQRAAYFKTVKQDSNLTRARSQDGQPVTYTKMKEKTNITRHSRAMSDPEIPGALVILNAKGLFQGKIGNKAQKKPESESLVTSLNIMDKDINRPMFFDPSLDSKEAKVSDLRRKFEAVESDIIGGKGLGVGSDFLNPLHKVNQDLGKTKREEQRASKTILEETLTFDEPVMQSALPVKKNKSTAESSAKESQNKVEMPTRPPPRLPVRDPVRRSRGESDPMPLDENQMSRVLAFPQDSLQSVKETIIEEDNFSQQMSETENFENTNDNYYGDEEDDDDGFDDDEWDSDFDDDDDDDDEQLKRDSRSSHDSSGDAEPLVSFSSFKLFT